MALSGNFSRLYNMIGNYRHLLTSRLIIPTYQPVATLKQTVEESIGLSRRPKKPLSAYFRFMRDLRPSLMAKHPTLKAVEITKLVAQEWHKADQQLKEMLQQEYVASTTEWHKAKADYYAKFTEEQKQQLEIAKLKEKHAKEQRLQRKKIQALGKPSRPGSAFALWVKSLSSKRGSIKISEWQKTLMAEWKTLPAKEKESFEVQAAEEMHKYRTKLKEWEEKMTNLGNQNLAKYGRQLNSTTLGDKKPAQ